MGGRKKTQVTRSGKKGQEESQLLSSGERSWQIEYERDGYLDFSHGVEIIEGLYRSRRPKKEREKSEDPDASR